MTFLARAPLSSCKSREARCSITHDRLGSLLTVWIALRWSRLKRTWSAAFEKRRR